MHVKINVINYIIIIFIDICINVMTKSFVRYMKHFAKFSANILNAIKNIKNLMHRAFKIVNNYIYILNVVKCFALSFTIFFYVLKNVKKCLTAIINVY